MPLKKVVNIKEKKENMIKRIYELLSKHKQIVVVGLLNVGSKQIQQIRRELLKKNSKLVIGKNTIIRKAIQLRSQQLPDGEEYDWFRQYGAPKKELEILLSVNKEKVGYIFTDEPIYELKEQVESNLVAQCAKQGQFAPHDVVIPPGATGMDPSMIGFFHALQVSTKIAKGQIEITKDYKVCTQGKKIGTSEIILLQKMDMKPFKYGMKVLCAYDDGNILSKEVVQLSPDDIIKKFQQGVSNLSALSIETGIPTELTIPSLISNAFKNLASIGLSIDYKFAAIEAAQMSAQSQPQQQEQKKEAKKEDKKVEEAPKQEEEENIDMGDLFG